MKTLGLSEHSTQYILRPLYSFVDRLQSVALIKNARLENKKKQLRVVQDVMKTLPVGPTHKQSAECISQSMYTFLC